MMTYRVLFILLVCFTISDAFSEENSDILNRIVDFEYIEKSNRHLASPLKSVEALSKAYSYVFNPDNKLVKFGSEFYSVNFFVLEEGYVVRFFIPFKSGVLVEPWSKYHNHVAVYVNAARSSVKQISNDEVNELVSEKDEP